MAYLDALALGWAAGTLVVVLAVGLEVLIGSRRIQRLADVAPLDQDALPSVSIVVAARNEQRDLEAGLRSLVRLDYHPLEIVAVDDRSTDETGAILERLAGRDGRLQVMHVAQLPPGWLGKNYALQIGARRAKGQFLLFTDADVVMEPSVVRRAVRYALQNNLDHLPIMPRVKMPNWFLEAFVVTFSLYFAAYWRPWQVKKAASRSYIGVGAFNLVRADVYRAVGTHQAIAMRPDDDLKLGKLIKKNGYRQEMLLAGPLIRVRWYGSLRELVVGLEKNLFAGVEYRVWTVVVSTLLMLSLHVWPFLAVFIFSGAARWIYVAVVLWLELLCYSAAAASGFRRWCVIAFPVTVVLFVYIQWRAMILALNSGGIRWRGTHYSLAELKANKV